MKKIKKIFMDIKKDYPITVLYIVGNFVNTILLRLFTTGHFIVRSVFFDCTIVVSPFRKLILSNVKVNSNVQ